MTTPRDRFDRITISPEAAGALQAGSVCPACGQPAHGVRLNLDRHAVEIHHQIAPAAFGVCVVQITEEPDEA